MNVAADINVTVPAWEAIADLEALTEDAVRECVRASGAALAPGCEVGVTFCGDAAIRALNARWRGQDKPTNVLSFPTPGPLARKPLLGDIVIAHETVAREAGEQDKIFRDHAAHMVIHGFLHLIGYDHETRAEAEAMEALERRIAASLGLGDPYEGEPLLRGARTNGLNGANVNTK